VEAPPEDAVSATSSIRRVLLLLAYDGTDYSGFALQSNAPTIVGELRRALLEIDPDVGTVTGSSRTDAGVHARNQPVSFTTTRTLKARGWVLALNQRLPAAIVVTYAAEVALNFDPRRAPTFKRYCYRIFNSPLEDPFISRMSWRVGQALHLPTMAMASQALLGEHDFRAFRSVDDPRAETVRTILALSLARDETEPRLIEVRVTGNRFMYNMVRIIVGTLVDIGRGRVEPACLMRALHSGARSDLGMTAPAHGLMLEHVQLGDWGSNGWPERGEVADEPTSLSLV